MFRGGSISSKDLTNQTIGHIKIEDFLFPPPLLPFERVSRHMRVTIHTEIEPPESRPCPPLPIDGPILLRALSSAASSHSTAVSGAPACLAFPASTLKKSSGDDVSTQDTSGAPTVPTPTVHVKFMLWDASSWLAVVLGMILILIILMIVPLPFSCRNLSPPFSHRGCSDARASEFCPAWRDSSTLLSESCPRLDLGDSSPRSSPYSCPTAAR
ncbi:hypothetical protein C8F04DRAFT_1237451, partial [Mycena alexandri]